jgi:hypothetical protein
MTKPSQKAPGGRALKKKIRALLMQPDFNKAVDAILLLPARQAVNPLFSFFYSGDDILRWRAITAMGVVVSRLAESDTESARVVMRRLIWNLNDESGGIGWGSPEAMGDITARSRRLAEEFGCILVSYIRQDGNYLEHEVLQRGALWGVGRLAGAHPDLAAGALGHFAPYLQTNDPWLRGLAAWAAGEVCDTTCRSILTDLVEDPAQLKIFRNDIFVETTVGELVTGALERLL